MASVNKVILVGNVGRDPEMRYMPSGDAVANFSIATTDTWKNKAGEKQEKTVWHRCSAFGKLAEIIGEYVKKGSPIYIEGQITSDEFTDKEGNAKVSYGVRVNTMQMLGNRTESSGSSTKQEDQKQSNGFEDLPDDLPF